MMNSDYEKALRYPMVMIAISAAVIHFLITHIIGVYIATAAGNVAGLKIATAITKRDKLFDVNAAVPSNYKIGLQFVSLPSGPFTRPIWDKIRNRWIYSQYKTLERDEVFRRLKIIDLTQQSINSIIFGILIYILIRIFKNRIFAWRIWNIKTSN